jgi:hypothetical protein
MSIFSCIVAGIPFDTTIVLIMLTGVGQLVLSGTEWSTVQRAWLIAVVYLLTASFVVGIENFVSYLCFWIFIVFYYWVLRTIERGVYACMLASFCVF